MAGSSSVTAHAGQPSYSTLQELRTPWLLRLYDRYKIKTSWFTLWNGPRVFCRLSIYSVLMPGIFLRSQLF